MWVEAVMVVAWLVVLIALLERSEKGRDERSRAMIERMVHPPASTNIDSKRTAHDQRGNRSSRWVAIGPQKPFGHSGRHRLRLGYGAANLDSRSGDDPAFGPIRSIGRKVEDVDSGSKSFDPELETVVMSLGRTDKPAFRVEKV